MLNVETSGPWKRLVLMLKNYDLRFKYVQKRVGVDAVEALIGKVKELAPTGPEFETYIDSLEAVELAGERGVLAFAVVSRRDKVKLGTVLNSAEVNKTVVYISPTATGLSSSVVEFLARVNPWPADLLPQGLNRQDVSLVHRMVSDDEMKFARRQVVGFIAENRAGLRQHGLSWGKVDREDEAVEGMESLPDYMWMALRTEFGVNAESRPHWRPAIKWLITNLQRIVDKDDKIRDALHDPMFRDHTLQNGPILPTMSMRQFDKESRRFQEKVLG